MLLGLRGRISKSRRNADRSGHPAWRELAEEPIYGVRPKADLIRKAGYVSSPRKADLAREGALRQLSGPLRNDRTGRLYPLRRIYPFCRAIS